MVACAEPILLSRHSVHPASIPHVADIGFLQSYDPNMGRLNVSCALGCRCGPVLLNGWHARHTSVLELDSVPVSASDKCVLRLLHISQIFNVSGPLHLARHSRAALDHPGMLPAAAVGLWGGSQSRKGHGVSMTQAGLPALSPHRSEISSKFKILSVIVPPFDMNRRSIVDLKNGEQTVVPT